MSKVFIVAAKRTAIGKFGGALKNIPASELAVPLVKDILSATAINPMTIDEVIMGNVYQAGNRANPARQVALKSGLPHTIPAMTINKQCASGLRAITLAYQQIALGEADCIVAGGTENMTRVPHLLLEGRSGKKLGSFTIEDGLLYDGLICSYENYHMGITAENLAEKYSISRAKQDEYALMSQQRALAAQQSGKFKKEIVPLVIGSSIFETDEFVRETTFDALSNLKPAFIKDGSVTAGNASGLNDGASLLLICSEKYCEEYKLKPLAEIIAHASVGVEPKYMGIGPVDATKKALNRANLTLEDIDLLELNEAFAAQTLAVLEELKINLDKVNVNGGAIALGHPVGNSGSRIVVTLLHELIRTNKSYGLASLCVGGGQGVSLIIKNIAQGGN
ncbi:thiolase family protein [Lysinibacillus odysseyi]|uniref:acetyl-CoA C-acetyltransferase n=1 Tax=Lysinibacillus odysseyi 34hs-1 = NBRC 100172 TaxID=1220589 RepID=A0A0A3IIR2_9BACI|nr:acetyl-CoA C-acetyltransferase [Lysinibacillus odysseyi]KGR82708.1 acetyl-CoA acetyltransferase [Lysinibacillus odysseyi 34hs-1 = NBRC 100172]